MGSKRSMELNRGNLERSFDDIDDVEEGAFVWM